MKGNVQNRAPEEKQKKKGLKFGNLKKLKKRTWIWIIGVLAVLILGAVVLVLSLPKRESNSRPGFSFANMGMNMQGGGYQMAMRADMVSASGVTSVGVTAETFDVENLTTALKIEEIYITSQQTVEQGSKVMKLSEESIAKARLELEKALKDADLAYRSGRIQYEQSLITAEYNRDNTLLGRKQAKEVYDETISGLMDSVENAREQLAQAREEIAEYRSYVNNDTYKAYFKVDEYQAEYDKTLEALKQKMEEWGISWSQIVSQGSVGGSISGSGSGNSSMGGGSSIGGSGSMPGAGSGFTGGSSMPGDGSGMMTMSFGDGQGNTGATSDQVQALSSLYKVLEKQRQDWEQAQSDYENALLNAAFELQTLELQIPELEIALAEAEKKYQNQLLQAELTYQTSLTNAQSAESDYEASVKQAETNFETLKKTWEDAKENLECFENSVGDGYFYASGNGTILRTMVRAGQNLTSEATVFMYSNPEETTVTVSVDQSNIARVALGDSVSIISSKSGGFEGVVTAVNPVSTSGSRASVAYSVTVKFVSDASKVSSNESVTVIFGMQGGFFGGQMPGGQMPEGFDMPNRNSSDRNSSDRNLSGENASDGRSGNR